MKLLFLQVNKLMESIHSAAIEKLFRVQLSQLFLNSFEILSLAISVNLQYLFSVIILFASCH